MTYVELVGKSYQAYKYAWCKQRGYALSDIDEIEGGNGECYASFDEFLNNEFQDEEYMTVFLDNATMAFWRERDRLKSLWIEQAICDESILQRVQCAFRQCPRCGGEMEAELAHNSFSRRANIYVCSACGMLEAIEDARKAADESFKKLPFEEWALIKLLIENSSLENYDMKDMYSTVDAKLDFQRFLEKVRNSDKQDDTE